MIPRAGLAALVLGAGLSASVGAVPTELDTRAFEFEIEVTLPAGRMEVWEAITGDISGWWDHRFSETSARFFIDARPGGGFWEYFDPAGGSGVRHAEVIFARKGETLRLEGPLGFSGNAVTIITSWTLADAGDGETVLTAKISFAGAYKEGWAEALERVWHHFMQTRLHGYLVAGCRGGGPCEAFQ